MIRALRRWLFWKRWRARALNHMIGVYKFPTAFAVECADTNLLEWFDMGYPVELALVMEFGARDDE